ncbi:MFS transporter [Catenovulum sediminis]|uniref:MFS transporter n=1 Tax=Catenovulum sediminis TaxID=1740262 RepID=A0ABV1RKW7_9ALTE|nr:MFS transporter [Catenovulum sediminis]
MRAWLSSDKARLSQVYFAYFTILGVISHYIGLYLHNLALQPFMIGSALAVMTVGRIIGPTVWANIGFVSAEPKFRIQFGCLFTLLSFSLLLFNHHFIAILIALGGFAFFWSAVLPQLETICQNVLQGDAQAYSRVRMWGSISFIGFVIIAGWMFEIYGIVDSVEYMTVVLLVLLFISSFRLPPSPVQDEVDKPVSVFYILKQKHIQVFFFCSFLLQLSFASYYGFFSIYLTEEGYSGYQIGALISVGVVAEIIIFLLAGRILAKFSLYQLFVFCLAITAVRWAALSWWGSITAVLIVIQVIHAFSYGLYHVCSQKFIHAEFKGDTQAKGQAWYLSFSYGLGGACGSLLAGISWQYYYHQTYMFSAVIVMFSVLFAARYLRR